MYILLTGAKKNAGDFLIAHSAKRLFERFAPDPTHQELPSWLPVTQHLDLINSSKALILCGGPAYQSGLGTRIYPILEDLDRIRVPIISFGLGWKSFPGDESTWRPSLSIPPPSRSSRGFGTISNMPVAGIT